MSAEEWIDREDKEQRAERIHRRQWIEENSPDVKLAFRGATAARLYEEAQHSYIFGHHYGCIVLSLAFIEQTLAAEFHSIHRSDLERESLTRLAKEARALGWLREDDLTVLTGIWDLRKPVTHFRVPGDPERIETRSYQEATPIEQILENDARTVLTVMFYLVVNRISPWSGQIPKNFVRT